GQSSLAGEYNATLRDELSRARDPQIQRALLSALGNAHREENVSAIAAFADSPQAVVRAQAAGALRAAPAAEARKTLLALAGDVDASVALSALGSLKQHQLEPS